MCWVYEDDDDLRRGRPGVPRRRAGPRRAAAVRRRAGDREPADAGPAHDLAALIARGAVETLTLAEVYAAGGPFRPERQLAYYDAATRRALDDGYRGLRVLAEVSDLAADAGRRARAGPLGAAGRRRTPRSGSGFSAMCAYRADLAREALADVAVRAPAGPRPPGGVLVPAVRRRRPARPGRQRGRVQRRPAGAGAAPRRRCRDGGVVLDVAALEFVDVAGCRVLARWAAGLRRAVGAAGGHRLVGAAAPDVAAPRPRPGGAGDVHGSARVTAVVAERPLRARGDVLPRRRGLPGRAAAVRPRGAGAGRGRRGRRAPPPAGPAPRRARQRRRDVEFLDMADIGANPARIIGVWADVLDRHTGAGRRLRGVGEPAFPGRRTAELAECKLHELLLNHAFDDGPGWRLLCPYDQEHLPRAVTQGALRTHPVRSTSGTRLPSDAYAAGRARRGVRRAAARARATPSCAAATAPGDIPATRRTVAQWARSCGLPEERVEVLELAASELATNSVRHGGGTGTVAMWLERGRRRRPVHRRRHRARPADRPADPAAGLRRRPRALPASTSSATWSRCARRTAGRRSASSPGSDAGLARPGGPGVDEPRRDVADLGVASPSRRWVSAWNAWSAVSLKRSIRMPLAWSITARDASAASQVLGPVQRALVDEHVAGDDGSVGGEPPGELAGSARRRPRGCRA